MSFYLRENNIVSAEFETIEVSHNVSFRVGRYEHNYFTRPWHYHPEFELILITKGFGTRMVGDHFEAYEAGDVVLVGDNLPHAWISDAYFLRSNHNDTCESVFIQFKKTVFGTQFIDIPELASIRTILKKAGRGIKLTGDCKSRVTQQMLELDDKRPFEQLLLLLSMLDCIHRSDYEPLASLDYMQRKVSFKSKKMTQLHNYLMQHFKSEVSIELCASEIGMTPTSLCRFMKKHTQVTFSEYINYLRINFAQRLLANTDLAIKEIGFTCGYTSIVYFNQVFKRSSGMSPKQYRLEHR